MTKLLLLVKKQQSSLNNVFVCVSETFLQEHWLHPGLRLHGNTDLLLHHRVGLLSE